MKDIIILGIESSCDETCVSIVKNGKEVLSNVISSQIDIHKLYGGVVPEIASRKHTENIQLVYDEAIKKSNIKLSDIDAIAVSYGPGLVGALLVGLCFAKGLCLSSNKKLIGINHLEGHIASNYISNFDLQPPFLCLIISGGHTNLILVEDYTKFKIYGKTNDDAVGESFDKIARSLGFEYPGGPKVEEYAKNGNINRFTFPRGNIKNNKYDFTFSGLKSHTINVINNLKQQLNNIPQSNIKNIELNKQDKSDICLAFEESVIDTLVSKTFELSDELKINKIAICGGVSANQTIINRFILNAKEHNKNIFYPQRKYTTDNAAMIASAGYYRYLNNDFSNLLLNANANLDFI